VRTRLDQTDVRCLAEAFELGEVEGWAEIPAGTINSNHRVDAGGRRWFVRVNEGKSEADVRWEAALVDELAARGVATPRPRRAKDGAPLVPRRDRWISVFPWIPGAHREAGEVSPGDAREVGRALARLHLAGAGLADRFAREGIYTTGHIAARHAALLGDVRAAGDPALAPALEAAGEELAWLAGRAARRAEAPRGIIHGDLFRDNVLFDGDRLAALLDFEQASSGAWIYDLAVCVNAWCFDRDVEPERARAMVAGYRAERALAPVEEELFPVELRAAAVRFLVTRITDVHLPGADLPGKDFRRYLARLERWRALGEAELVAWARAG